MTPLMRLNFRLAQLSPRVEVLMLSVLSPSTVSVAAPVLLGIPARSEADT